MRITEGMLSTGGLGAVLKNSGLQKAEKAESPVKRDSAVFSSKSQSLGGDAEVQSAKARAMATPDVREAKIAEVRSKIENGYYDSEEFQDVLADRLIKDM